MAVVLGLLLEVSETTLLRLKVKTTSLWLLKLWRRWEQLLSREAKMWLPVYTNEGRSIMVDGEGRDNDMWSGRRRPQWGKVERGEDVGFVRWEAMFGRRRWR
ncbi:hypothetical protein NC653_039806 [Populus alba x Populus x berolinensis]|uniref:Uncharacterized protein n=2 Tax=Populus TaxID=3689 RepID=A0A4U5MN73_POPAL|nr:hypothetical protein NC653_039806 [Populus alba x Populus x berolinensis]TKR70997.1 hypothetical protein D5086_0000305630 [Populus alba]